MLPRKQLLSIVNTLKFWQEEEQTEEVKNIIYGMERILIIQDNMTQVRNEIFRSKQKPIIQDCIDRLQDLIRKNFKGFNIESVLNGVYESEIDFMDRLKDDEKAAAKGCINYILEYKI